ncbi:MAG: hypothetical protein ACQSGP_24325, partial [Frankia sp.]
GRPPAGGERPHRPAAGGARPQRPAVAGVRPHRPAAAGRAGGPADGRLPRSAGDAVALRAAARDLMLTGRISDAHEMPLAATLLISLAGLLTTISRLREVQQRVVQAAAARDAGSVLLRWGHDLGNPATEGANPRARPSTNPTRRPRR